MSVRVLICDDQPLVRAGVRTLLSTQADIEIVGDATDGAAAIVAAGRWRPNVVLMDIRMPGTDGITATQRITAGERAPRVLVLTTYDQDEYVFNALAAGASGFLLKDARPEDLISGIRSVAAGDALLAPSVTRRLIGLFAHDRPAQSRRAGNPVGLLTNREREVLHLVARGLSNTDIATTLHITDHTVKTHVANLLNKLDLRDRVHAVIFAYEHGVIDRGLEQL
ncbi:MAG TPA: response regulator transcription factor [Pseudonocardiaceae bacterium]|nr:response regulator transcription factor [Pseudonocardiaceae bacterium]